MTETAIADHGLIGDLQTAALVTTDGSIDWFCAPRFDSPSVFGALLDDERGGRFRIRPAGTKYTSKQAYFPDTAVLVTRFFTADGLGQVVDFLPPAGSAATTTTGWCASCSAYGAGSASKWSWPPGSTTAAGRTGPR